MRKIASVTSVVVLSLFLISAVLIYRKNPNILPASFFIGAIPYVLTLIAIKSREGIAICVSGLIANGFYSIVGIGGFLYSVAGYAALPLQAALASLIIAMSCSINFAYFMQMLKSVARPQQETAP